MHNAILRWARISSSWPAPQLHPAQALEGCSCMMLCRWDRRRELVPGSHHCHGHDGSPHPAPHSRHRSTIIECNPEGTCTHAACLLTGVHLLSKPYSPSNCTKHHGFHKSDSQKHTRPLNSERWKSPYTLNCLHRLDWYPRCWCRCAAMGAAGIMGHSLVMPVRILMIEKEMAELVKRLKSRFSSCL